MIDTLNGVKAKYNWGAPHWSNHSYSHWIGYCNLMQLLLSECAMKILLPFSFLIKKTPNGSHYFGCLKNWTSIVQVFHELSIILPMIFQYFPRYFPIVSGKFHQKMIFPMIFQYFPMIFQDISIILSPSAPRQVAGAGFESKSSVRSPGSNHCCWSAGWCSWSHPVARPGIMVCSSVKILFIIHIYIIYVCVHTNYIWIYIHMCANFEVAPWFLMGLTPVQYDFGCKATPWRWGLDMPMAALEHGGTSLGLADLLGSH